jgi:hypothetical protein
MGRQTPTHAEQTDHATTRPLVTMASGRFTRRLSTWPVSMRLVLQIRTAAPK